MREAVARSEVCEKPIVAYDLETTRMREAVARSEVCEGAASIADLTGVAPRLFRPSHGRLRRCMIEKAEGAGQSLRMWDVSAMDWGSLAMAAAIARRLAATQPGDIVLMHDRASRINRPGELIVALLGCLADFGRRGLVPDLLSDVARRCAG